MINAKDYKELIMKKKILIVYYEMMLGGSTTSLLSLLYNFNYSKYDVDLLLYRNQGPFFKYIPKEVNILPQAMRDMSRNKKIIRAIMNGELMKNYYAGMKYYHKVKRSAQQSAYMQAAFCRDIDMEYDVAIGFMELWSDVFVNKYVRAKKKISWIHVDYEKAHYVPVLDRETFSESDYIVNVSEQCLENFNQSFPYLKNKTVYIENILTKKFVLERFLDADNVDIEIFPDNLNLLSVCRIAIEHKGLDRGLEVISRLVENGKKICWHIIGDGPDMGAFIEMINEKNAGAYVFLYGSMECPFKLYNKFDAFLLPSRFEGKPMAVTEAQMLGLPPIVTKYASAHEQIDHGISGFIAENNVESLERLLHYISENPDILNEVRENLVSLDFDNVESIDKIYDLIEK